MSTDNTPDNKAEQVSETIFRERERTFQDALKDAASAVDDPEGFGAAWAAARQVAGGLDPERMLNTPHVPENAGEHKQALTDMLARIPDGWGRWVSCGRGWYPLIVAVDAQLRELLPTYQIQQIKEKYGSLCYYWDPGEEVLAPDDPCPEYPGKEATEESQSAWKQAHSEWWERGDTYRDTPEGRGRLLDLRRRVEAATTLVRAAEEEAGRTCERCGQPGESCCSLSASPWYQTLCPLCALERGFIPAGEWEAWWEREEPHFQARQRGRFIAEHTGKRVVVASADPEVKISLSDAVYCHTPEAAAEAASEDWDLVFVDDDEVGGAFAAALARRYANEPLKGEHSWRIRGYYLQYKLGDDARTNLKAAGAWMWGPQAEHRAGAVENDTD